MNRTANLAASVSNLTLPEPPAEPTEKIPTILFDPAYSGGLLRMNPDVWPLPVVFDVDGLEERPQNVPIIRDHDQNQKVGQTDAVEYDGGKIVARGRLINFGIDPAAGKVVARRPARSVGRDRNHSAGKRRANRRRGDGRGQRANVRGPDRNRSPLETERNFRRNARRGRRRNEGRRRERGGEF